MKKQLYAITSTDTFYTNGDTIPLGTQKGNFFWTLLKKLVVGCFLFTLPMACSVGLHNRQASTAKTKSYPNLVEIYTDRLQPMPDSLHTIVALTPMTGANADSLFKGNDKFVIQYPTDLNQAVPAGIDVLYLNADFATSAHDYCGLLDYATSNNNIKIMIDGSVKNIEKFCKANFNIYNPKSELMVYENIPPDSSAEMNIPYGGFSTMAYGQKYNHISYDMLIESIFDFSVNDKYTTEDYIKASKFDYNPKSPETIAQIAKMEAQRKQYAQNNKPQSVLNPIELTGSPLLFASKGDDISSLFPSTESPKLPTSSTASFVYDTWPYCNTPVYEMWRFNYLWNADYKKPLFRSVSDLQHALVNSDYSTAITPHGYRGSHVLNPDDNFLDNGYFYRGLFNKASRYDRFETWPVRRLNCQDNDGTRSMKVTHTHVNAATFRRDNPVDQLLTQTNLKRFGRDKEGNFVSGYIEFGVNTANSWSYTTKQTGGSSYGYGVDVTGVSIKKDYERTWSNGNTSAISFQKTNLVEYFLNDKCMIAMSDPIYGRLQAFTKIAYVDASTVLVFVMLYTDEKDNNETVGVKFALTAAETMPRYQGHLRHSNSFWIRTLWYRDAFAEKQILSFKNCGK